jgi:hypothetical protein
MSRYDWPYQRRAVERDDATGRARFVARHRTELDITAALAASRGSAAGGPGRVGVLAAANSRTDLWVPLGPSTVVHGQAAGNPRVTGRVRCLYVHPDGQRLYAGTANGGLWYSRDGGESWQSIGGLAPTATPGIVRPAHRHASGAILVLLDPAAPDDESKDTVLVGTGEITPSRLAHPGAKLGGIGVLVATGPATSADPDPWVEEAPNLLEKGVYRLAVQPGGATVVAATSIGLLQRPAGAGQGSVWDRVAGEPFEDLEAVVTDVLWTAAVAGGAPGRLWAWVKGDRQGGLWVRDDGDSDFRRIDTPQAEQRRSSIAAATPPSTLYLLNDQGDDEPPALFRVTSPADPADPTAQQVAGVPDMVGSQGGYDLAIAVDPTNPDQVVLGGSFFEGPPDAAAVAGQNVNAAGETYPEDAAIFAAEVGLTGGTLTYGHAGPPVRIGVGCHADVHDLHFADAGSQLWAAGDGGVFRSMFPQQNSGFVARNTGLAVIQSNYVAAHPTCEGRVALGLQDNGVVERASSAVWGHSGDGDGGGIAFDPRLPTRYVRQYFDGQWTSSDGNQFDKLLYFRPPAAAWTEHANAKKERRAAAFYSTVATIAHTRGAAAAPTHTQVLIGTTRAWFSEDWGASWVTLPTGTDPITATTFDAGQDDVGQPITVCAWATSDVAWILSDSTLARLVRVAGSDAGGGPGSWSRDVVLDKTRKPKKGSTSSTGPIHRAVIWTDVAPNLDAPGVLHGPKGAAYLGALGDPDDAAVDTLWWFDGTDTWHPTGLRGEVQAPVTAVRCDPRRPDDVYVGTTIGVWHGVRHLADPPRWDWAAMVNGLPEATVEDLALFEDGDLRLLRAAISARGLWEVRLGRDAVDVTYLRAHDDDLRYRDRALQTQRDLTTPRSWHGSPDIRPRVTPAAIPAPVATLTRVSPGPPERLRRFQAALRSFTGDDRVRATGEWDLYFEDVLRDLGAPTHPVTGRAQIDATFWSSVMVAPHATREPWATAAEPDRGPTEADLADLTPKIDEGEADSVSQVVTAVPHKVDVVVHHRGLDPRPSADVRVTLLRWTRLPTDPVPRRDDPSTWFTGSVPWAAAADEVLNSAAGTTTQTFAGGWRFVGSTAATRRKTLAGPALHSDTSGVVTFDLDLSPFRNNTVMLLAAVIRAGGDSALASKPAADLVLRDLALTDPHVAVRSVVIERP